MAARTEMEIFSSFPIRENYSLSYDRGGASINSRNSFSDPIEAGFFSMSKDQASSIPKRTVLVGQNARHRTFFKPPPVSLQNPINLKDVNYDRLDYKRELEGLNNILGWLQTKTDDSVLKQVLKDKGVDFVTCRGYITTFMATPYLEDNEWSIGVTFYNGVFYLHKQTEPGDTVSDTRYQFGDSDGNRSTSGYVRKTIQIESTQCGRLIGPRGAQIRKMQEQSGATIKIPQRGSRGSGKKTPVDISGMASAVTKAVKMIKDVLLEGESFGYGFETCVTSDDGVSPPDPDKAANNYNSYYTVVYRELNQHHLLMDAELDCYKDLFDDSDLPPPRPLPTCIELTTTRMDSSMQSNFTQKPKYLKWWAQSYVLGIKDIVCGLYDENSRVTQLKTYKIDNMPREMVGTYDVNVCLDFLDRFLTHIKDVVLEDENKGDVSMVYVFERKKFSQEITCKKITCDEKRFLRNAYTTTAFLRNEKNLRD